MPIWDDEESTTSSQPQSINQRVRAGNALPILSHTAMFDLVLFGHEAFTRYYAEKIGYPYPNLPDVGQLANYDRYTNRASDVDCKEFYLDCLKNHIFREAKAGGMDPDTLAEAKAQVDSRGRLGVRQPAGLPALRPAAGLSPAGIGQPPLQDLPDDQRHHLSGGRAAQGRQRTP